MPFRPPGRRGVTPGGRGGFSGFDVLDQVEYWDDVTAGAVLARLDPGPELSFFTDYEGGIAGALFDRLLAQDDEPKVPVLLLVDHRLATGQTDGWRYEDLPEDTVAWRRTLALLDDDARQRHGQGFATLPVADQGELIGEVAGADEWHGLSAGHVWSLWTRYAATAFYSHPWAWNEIGFGGPAYPRGYSALGVGKREHWEVPDARDSDPVSFESRVRQIEAVHRRPAGAEDLGA
ncbi:MAG: gluconate 2-dehydrogenase subunit 3 family protein [Acidobacteriota bacterium]|nr:gluconate 2-dehydrogenase subunit 3 family protein [Acidobacteriota bacterium]